MMEQMAAMMKSCSELMQQMQKQMAQKEDKDSPKQREREDGRSRSPRKEGTGDA